MNGAITHHRIDFVLRVLKNIYYIEDGRAEIPNFSSSVLFSTREEKFRISKRPCNVLLFII